MVPLLADVIWPALFLEQRMNSTWAIGLGLIIEYFIVRRITGFRPGMTLVASVAMNAASAFVGYLLLPETGIAWELYRTERLQSLHDLGTFNRTTWGVTYVFAVVLNVVIESAVLCIVFGQPLERRGLAWLTAANCLSVGFALLSIFVWSPVH